MQRIKYLFLILISSTSIAATTGSIVLSGTIPPNTSITVTPVGSYNNLDLVTTAIDSHVANIREKNNTLNGYQVTISSANAGKLKNGSSEIPYTAKYNGVGFTLGAVPVQVTNQGIQSSLINVVKQLSISYTGVDPDTYMTGTYTDTLTVIIQAN